MICDVIHLLSFGSILDCSKRQFNLKTKLPDIEYLVPDDICYIKKFDLIVLSSWVSNRICAVNSSDGQIVWDKSRQVADDKLWCPNTLALLSNQGLLLMADRYENWILILSCSTGDILHTTPLQESESGIIDFHLFRNKLLVYHPTKISYYTVGVLIRILKFRNQKGVTVVVADQMKILH